MSANLNGIWALRIFQYSSGANDNRPARITEISFSKSVSDPLRIVKTESKHVTIVLND